MIKDGTLYETSIQSPLTESSVISPRGKNAKNKLVAGVILTSLIDAFSILVIYLLVNFSTSGEILYISKDMELPSATKAQSLERTTLVKIENGQWFIEDKPVQQNQLVKSLVNIRKKLARGGANESDVALTIQADRRLKYKVLNKIVLAGSHAGFGEIKFAVITR